MSRWSLFVLLFALLAAPAAAQVIPSGPVGALNYWGVGGLSQVLNPGLAGQCLTTQGVGSAPVWVNCQVSSLSLLPPINTNQFYGNVSGQFSPPVGVDVNTILNTVGYDIVRPPTPESIIYKSNVGPTFNWQALPPGPSGALLTSGGPTNPPFWATSTAQASLASICQTIGAVLYFDTPSLQWKCLNPGTSGQVLQTGGSNGNPTWLTLAPSATTNALNASNITSGTLPASVLPLPTASSLGGTFSASAPANQFQTGINTSGAPTFAQPGFANLSGIASLAQGGLGGSQAGATANQIPVYPGSAGAAAPTSVGGTGGLFDAICSSTIGQIWVRLSSGWGCTSLGYANPVWWGADPTGASDSASAFNSALAASTYIKFPPGKFKLNSAISYTIASGFTSLKVEGSGIENTKLFWPNAAGGMTVTYNGVGSSTTFQDLTFTTGQASGGTGLTLSLASGGAASNNVPSFMYRVSFRGDDGPISGADYWTTGLNLSGISEFNSDSLWIYGSATALAGTGVVLSSTPSNIGGVFNFSKLDSQFSATGVNYGANIQGVTFDQSNFTDDGIGISVPAGATNSLQLSVTNSQFAGRTFGILIQTSIQTFISNNFFLPGGYVTNSVGLSLAPDTACVVVGNVFQLNSPTFATGSLGLNLSGTATANCNIVGNVFSGLATGLGMQSTSGRVNVQANTFVGNTTAIVNSSTAPNNVIENNLGYNPVGPAAISVGASPFTYVAGASPETVYIFGGTITAVTFDKNGGGLTAGACTASVAVTAQCTIDLGPNETLKVTYTAAPGMNKMIH